MLHMIPLAGQSTKSPVMVESNNIYNIEILLTFAIVSLIREDYIFSALIKQKFHNSPTQNQN